MRTTALGSIFSRGSHRGVRQETAWQALIDAKAAQRVYIAGFNDDTRGITAGYAGATYYSENAGSSWTKAANISMCRYGLDILDGGVAVTCGNGGDNRISLDGGKTWSAMRRYGPSEPDQFRFASFLDAKTGWIGGPLGIASTADSGATWSEIKLPPGVENIAAIALLAGGQGKVGFALGADGSLSRTNDGGATWTTKAIAASGADVAFTNASNFVSSAAMRFQSQAEGLVVAYRRNPKPAWVALSTTDGGDSWTIEDITSGIEPAGSVYLSTDGRYATLYYSHRVVVFKRAPREGS